MSFYYISAHGRIKEFNKCDLFDASLYRIESSIIFTTCKRSLGQGNIFTPVCHSVHRGGICLSACWDTTPRNHAPPGAMQHPLQTMHHQHPTPGAEHAGRYGQCAGGTHPTGMQSCFIVNQSIDINDKLKSYAALVLLHCTLSRNSLVHLTTERVSYKLCASRCLSPHFTMI